MNNNQFILIVVWISILSGLIGYTIGGIVIGVMFAIMMPMIFIGIGD